MRVWVQTWVGVLGTIPSNLLKRMAGTTGLEPAASAVTGQRSNQLNYVPTCQINEVRNRQGLCGVARIACLAQSASIDTQWSRLSSPNYPNSFSQNTKALQPTS